MNALAGALFVALAAATALASGARAVQGAPRTLPNVGAVRVPGPIVDLAERARTTAGRFSARRRFHRTLPRYVEAVARELRGGSPTRLAVLEGADAAGGPFRSDVARLARRLDAGQTVPEVIRWWAADRRSPELARLALVADAGSRVGGELARALDGVAVAMTDRRDVAAEARSLSSQARASAVLLVAAPLLFAVAMAGVQPEGVRFLVGTPLGWATLVAALLLDAVGGFWMYRLTERVR